MYKVDIDNKSLIKLTNATFSDLGLKERFDIQEWISKMPEILGEELLILAKEYELPSRSRLDLLAVDKQAGIVIIELKRDSSGNAMAMQGISYASYLSSFTNDEIFNIFAEYEDISNSEAELRIEEFIDTEMEKLNENQRIILASKEFHSDVISSVLWLRDFSIDVQCVKLEPFTDSNQNLFLNANKIIPLPEAADYVKRKETKAKEKSLTTKQSSFSLEVSNYDDEQLSIELIKSLTRDSELTPRLHSFISILLSEERSFSREEIKQKLFEGGIGDSLGKAGNYLSGISKFLTKKSTPHLRQVISFGGGDGSGAKKSDYQIIPEHRNLVTNALKQSVVNV